MRRNPKAFPNLLACCALAGATLLAASSARAYDVRRTSDGVAVHWEPETGTVNVMLDDNLLALAPRAAVEDAVKGAFHAWSRTAGLPFNIWFLRGKCGRVGYDENESNLNCVTAGYLPREEGKVPAAKTILTYERLSGRILDADIVFNMSAGPWAEREGDPGTDPRTAALHEVGHFIGMEHSDVEDAVMYGSMREGEAERELVTDDIEGAWEIYGEPDLSLGPEGCAGLSTVAPGRPGGSHAFLVLLLLAAALRKAASVCRLRARRASVLSKNDER
jgi:hypothetical protein